MNLISPFCNPVLCPVNLTGSSQYGGLLEVHCAQLGNLSYMELEQDADSVTSIGQRP